jgi:hypothetical protein
VLRQSEWPEAYPGFAVAGTEFTCHEKELAESVIGIPALGPRRPVRSASVSRAVEKASSLVPQMPNGVEPDDAVVAIVSVGTGGRASRTRDSCDARLEASDATPRVGSDLEPGWHWTGHAFAD